MQSNRPARRRLAHVACAFALLLTAYPAGAPDAGPDQAAIDRFITDRLEANNLPGVAVAITAGDRQLHLRGYGKAGPGESVTPQTQFRIGSLSKSFTAAAVLQLVDAGQISLDAPVVEYLPDFRVDDPRSDRITVRHLLNHTSGLSDQAYPAGALPPRARSPTGSPISALPGWSPSRALASTTSTSTTPWRRRWSRWSAASRSPSTCNGTCSNRSV